MAAIDRCYNVEDFRKVAKKRLPKWIFEFVDRGTEDETAMPHIRHAFNRIKLKNRALVDMTKRDLGTTLFGKRIALPMAIAPTGSAGLCWYEGELALAKAATRFGIPFTMAVSSTTPLEKVAEHCQGGSLWFQMYLWNDRARNDELARRAERAGYEALFVTVDVNLGVNREFNVRNAYGNPPKFGLKTLLGTAIKPDYATSVMLRYLLTTGMPRQANNPQVTRSEQVAKFRGDSNFTWDDLARLRDVFRGKLVLKGIVRPDDAAKAVSLGVDGVVVSSHGGRNFDCNVASLDALPHVVREVGHKTTVLFDTGIRRGSDMVKALALGAKAVLSGRATLYATAAGGEAGATKALNLLKREYELTLGHVGCLNCSELSHDVLATDQSLMGMDLDGLEGPVRMQMTA